MTSLVDMEDPARADYFGNLMTDAVEPSSSPSDDNVNSPYRTFIEEQIRSSDQGSTSSGRKQREYPIDGQQPGRKTTRFYVQEGRDFRKMSALLLLTSERLEQEILRANEAERKLAHAMALLRSATESKFLAQQDAARLGEELSLYKLQYQSAQNEIFKAQAMINRVEAQRQEAEEAAARARSTARQLKEENMVMMAREDGRHLGYQEGLKRGRRIGYEEGQDTARFDVSMQRNRRRGGDTSDGVDLTSSSNVQSPQAVPVRGQEPLRSRASRYSGRRSANRSEQGADFPVPKRTAQMKAPSDQVMPSPPAPASNIIPAVGRKSDTSQTQAHPPPVRSPSQSPGLQGRLSIPPDNWIPIADENNYIAMPPPHHMSPVVSPLHPDQVLPEDEPLAHQGITTESAVAGTSILVRDYAYPSTSNLKGPVTHKEPHSLAGHTSPQSQASTRISSYGILTSPPGDRRHMRQLLKNGTIVSVTGEMVSESDSSEPNTSELKYGPRSWYRNKSRSLVTPRVSGVPRFKREPIPQFSFPVPPPGVIQPEIDSKPPVEANQSPKSLVTSESWTSLHVDEDFKRESNSRKSLNWFKFKKRNKDQSPTSNEGDSSSSAFVEIDIVSPSNPSSPRSGSTTAVVRPGFLSPEYRDVHSSSQPSNQTSPGLTAHSTPQQTFRPKQQSSLPPLAELGDLISPAAESSMHLPLGFVPQRLLQSPIQQHGMSKTHGAATHATTEIPVHHPGSWNRGSPGGYETAPQPLPPGVFYPSPSSPPQFESSRSRMSGSQTMSPLMTSPGSRG